MEARKDPDCAICPRTPTTSRRATSLPGRWRAAPSSIGRASRTQRQAGEGHARGDRRASRELDRLRGFPGQIPPAGARGGAGKKRLGALADGPTAGAKATKPARKSARCPKEVNAPQSVGDAVWRLTASWRDLRIIPGAVVGFDIRRRRWRRSSAMGIDRAAVVELLPVIEAQMVAAVNRQMRDQAAAKGRDPLSIRPRARPGEIPGTLMVHPYSGVRDRRRSPRRIAVSEYCQLPSGP